MKEESQQMILKNEDSSDSESSEEEELTLHSKLQNHQPTIHCLSSNSSPLRIQTNSLLQNRQSSLKRYFNHPTENSRINKLRKTMN